jgi:hypothetical protein
MNLIWIFLFFAALFILFDWYLRTIGDYGYDIFIKFPQGLLTPPLIERTIHEILSERFWLHLAPYKSSLSSILYPTDQIHPLFRLQN